MLNWGRQKGGCWGQLRVLRAAENTSHHPVGIFDDTCIASQRTQP